MEWETIGPYKWRQEVSSYDDSVSPSRPLWRVYIKGVAGNAYTDDIVWCVGREDLLATYYWSMIAVLDGHYHCCFSGRTFIF
jgi:hypothetical protein